MFLADTNIFLEILLKRDKKERCKKFLDDNIINLSMTDFSLHSVGVILFRYGKVDVFLKFAEDVALNAKLLSLPIESYHIRARKLLNLFMEMNCGMFKSAYPSLYGECVTCSVVGVDLNGR